MLRATTLFGQFVPIGPFTGTMSETLESFPNYNNGGTLLSGTAFFGGAATITHNERLSIYEPSAGATYSITEYPAPVVDGTKAAGFGIFGNGPPNAALAIAFASPITDFGGYFGSIALGTQRQPITLSFSDSNGTVIASDTFPYTALNGAMQWEGWHFNAPVSTVTFQPMHQMVFDSLQANSAVVPEPSAIALLLAGAAMLAVRSRKNKSRSASAATSRSLAAQRR